MTPGRWRDWLRPPRLHPARAALLAAMAAVLACGAWLGVNRYRFDRDLGAAKQALTGYDFPEARRRLASCLGWRPGDPGLLLLAAEAARRDGLLDEAEGYLNRHRDRGGGRNFETALQGVLLEVQRGRVKEHVDALLEQLEIRHPKSEQILEALAHGSVHAYHLREADFWTKQLLSRFPNNPGGRLLDAQADQTLGRRDLALEKLRKLVEDHPGYDKARISLAELLFKLHRYPEAVDHYRELHRRQPGEVVHLLGLVRSLTTLERLDEARPQLRELEQSHGDNSEALLECGRFALRQGWPADAEALLRRAERLAPFDHQIQSELAVCLKQLGRAEEAEQHLQRFRQIEADLVLLEKAFVATVKDPRDPGPRREAGRVCLRNGQTAEGLRWLYGALDVAPNDRQTHQILADHFTAQGDERLARIHRGKAK